MADREAWYGDPRQSEVPVAALLSPEYAARRRALITGTASAALVPGDPAGVPGRLPGYALAAFGGPGNGAVAGGTGPGGSGAGAGIGEPTLASGAPQLGLGDTCHLDVADRFGNLVSCTPSGGWLQSSPVVPGLGFCLGSRAQMFALTPGFASTLAPGRRPRTTLSPSLALRDGEPYLAFGTPGGDQQDQWTLAVFLNHAVFGMNLQEAIDFPAFHTDHMPSSFYPRARAAPVAGGRVARRRGGHRGPARPRPRRVGARPVVAGPGQRGGAVGRLPVRGGQPARHAGLRGRPLARPQRAAAMIVTVCPSKTRKNGHDHEISPAAPAGTPAPA